MREFLCSDLPMGRSEQSVSRNEPDEFASTDSLCSTACPLGLTTPAATFGELWRRLWPPAGHAVTRPAA